MKRFGLLMGVLLLLAVVFAAEEARSEPKKEDTAKADLAACQAQVQTLQRVLNGLAHGIQTEMELAQYRLNTTIQVKDSGH